MQLKVSKQNFEVCELLQGGLVHYHDQMILLQPLWWGLTLGFCSVNHCLCDILFYPFSSDLSMCSTFYCSFVHSRLLHKKKKYFKNTNISKLRHVTSTCY